MDVQDVCSALHVPMDHHEYSIHKLLLMLHVVLMHLELKSSIPRLLLIALTLLFPLFHFLFQSPALIVILLVIYRQHNLAET